MPSHARGGEFAQLGHALFGWGFFFAVFHVLVCPEVGFLGRSDTSAASGTTEATWLHPDPTQPRRAVHQHLFLHPSFRHVHAEPGGSAPGRRHGTTVRYVP